MLGRGVSAAGLIGAVVVALILVASPAASNEFTGDEPVFMSPPISLGAVPTASRARRARTLSEPETTYVGFTPGHSADNYWSIWAGSGADGYGRAHTRKGVWDFEPSYADVHGDSLQGWWPYRAYHSYNVNPSVQDTERPWQALDIGNNANYSGPFGTGADKRTVGVVGVWHVDTGNTGAGAGQGVSWSPFVGTGAAWMGLRRSGDDSQIEHSSRGGTGNALNEDMVIFDHLSGAAGGTASKFPGYASQMDQLLYRDIDLSGPGDSSLTVSFQYRTAMSTSFAISNVTRTGWFVHDPYTVTTGGANPNFISNHSTTPAPPADSFMVYVGVGAEGSVLLSDGQVHPIGDPKRRWFGEVLRSNEGLYHQILSAGGTTSPAGVLHTVTIGSGALAPLKSAGANRVRLVFRVKTNRFYDDGTSSAYGYSSGGVGAAIVDDVRIVRGNAPSTVLGAFDDPSEIDQRTEVSALSAWKSTGKPPQAYSHVHALAGLSYEDLCGPVGSSTRFCNMAGFVVASVNHDYYDAYGQSGAAFGQEPSEGLMSPTIQLCGPYDGPGGTNRMGITAAQAQLVAESRQEILADEFAYGQAIGGYVGIQSYPAGNTETGAGEHKRWSSVRNPSFGPGSADGRCYYGPWNTPRAPTTNPSGIPDSIRLVLRSVPVYYGFYVPDPYDSDRGVYWDNVSLAIIDPRSEPEASIAVFHPFHDTFPFSDTVTPGVAASFDTASALIKTGNRAAGYSTRYVIPADTVLVSAEGASVRVDLVFRILPGPGNYVDPAQGGNSPLKAVPTSMSPIPSPALGTANFWSSYLYDNGAHGTPGGHPGATSGPLAGQKVWSPHVWNSARCDTAEQNVFASSAYAPYEVGRPRLGSFMSAYHETEISDPHRGALGVARNICFVADSAHLYSPPRTICGSGAMPPGATYPPAWTYQPGSGKPSSCTSGNCVTREGTKIIPDGLLTPGAHVQYFFRREDAGSPGFVMFPDTNRVAQDERGWLERQRWMQFGVLPDRWKSPLYRHPVLGTFGSGEACMLVIDQTDGRGDETAWAGTADSIGATAPEKFGAHNGWHAPGNGDPNDPASFVRAHIGQPGTTWDLYSVKDGESDNARGSIGSRLGYSDPTNTQMNEKRSRLGPSPAMLSGYYRVMVMLASQASAGFMGPTFDESQDDIGILQQWLSAGNPSQPDRGFWLMGEGVVEANEWEANRRVFDRNVLGVQLRDPRYQELAVNPAFTVDISPSAVILPAGGTVGISSSCQESNDVLDASAELSSEASGSAFFEPVGGGAPYAASILKSHTPANPWIALTDAFNLTELASKDLTSTAGRRLYVHGVLNNVFGAICNLTPGPLVGAPDPSDAVATNFVRVLGNPAIGGRAAFRIGMARPGHLELRIYDVAGRLMRTLVDGYVHAGARTVVWDGRDSAGKRVPGGVFFARVGRDKEFEAARRVVVIR